MNRIKQLRKNKCLTLDELGKKVQIPNNTLSQYENEKRKPKLEPWLTLNTVLNGGGNYEN